MIYQVIACSEHCIAFATHRRARRGRGVLFSLAPIVLYVLAVTLLFGIFASQERVWNARRVVSSSVVCVVAVVSALAFAAGYRAQTRVEATAQTLAIERVSPWGHRQRQLLECSQLHALEIGLSVRSLGADVALWGIDRASRRILIAEGDAHSGQLGEIAQSLARITRIPLSYPGPGSRPAPRDS